MKKMKTNYTIRLLPQAGSKPMQVISFFGDAGTVIAERWDLKGLYSGSQELQARTFFSRDMITSVQANARVPPRGIFSDYIF